MGSALGIHTIVSKTPFYKPETSRRIRMRIETIVDYAIARKVFNGASKVTTGAAMLWRYGGT